jgi:hypothetical protein
MVFAYLKGILFGKPKTYRKVLQYQDDPSYEICKEEGMKDKIDALKDYQDTMEGGLVVKLQGELQLNRNPCRS